MLLQGVREQGAEEDIWAEEGAHNWTLEKLHYDLYSATNIMRMIKSTIGNAGHVARNGDKNA